MFENLAGWIGTDILTFRRVSSLVIIVLITFITASIAKRFLKKAMGQPIVLAHGRIKYEITDDTRYRVVSRLLVAMVYIIGIAVVIFSIPELRTLSLSLLAGAGVVAVIIGFATQKTFSNIVSSMQLSACSTSRICPMVRTTCSRSPSASSFALPPCSRSTRTTTSCTVSPASRSVPMALSRLPPLVTTS